MQLPRCVAEPPAAPPSCTRTVKLMQLSNTCAQASTPAAAVRVPMQQAPKIKVKVEVTGNRDCDPAAPANSVGLAAAPVRCHRSPPRTRPAPRKVRALMIYDPLAVDKAIADTTAIHCRDLMRVDTMGANLDRGHSMKKQGPGKQLQCMVGVRCSDRNAKRTKRGKKAMRAGKKQGLLWDLYIGQHENADYVGAIRPYFDELAKFYKRVLPATAGWLLKQLRETLWSRPEVKALVKEFPQCLPLDTAGLFPCVGPSDTYHNGFHHDVR